VWRRWIMHVSAARGGDSGCLAFAAAIRKYGRDAFTHEVLEVVDTSVAADEAERAWISRLSTIAPNGYNLRTGGSRANRLVSERGKRAMSDAMKAWHASKTPEERRELSRRAGLISASASPEERRERSRRAHAATTPEQMREASRKGNATLGPEGRSERSRRCNASLTPEQRSARSAKMWAALPQASREEHDRKLREFQTPEERENRSRFHQQRWAQMPPEQRGQAGHKAWRTRRLNSFRRLVAKLRTEPVVPGYGC
jgi:hypothetical protein